MTNSDGIFDFTVSSEDSNLRAREYCEPIVRRFVSRHDGSEIALVAACFLSGTLKGMLGFIRPGDAIYLNSLAAPIPEEVRQLWVRPRKEGPQDPLISIEGPQIYHEPRYHLWYKARNERQYYLSVGQAMPELQALHYAGWTYRHQVIGRMPAERYDEMMGLLAPYVRDVKPFQDDLVFDPKVIEKLRVR
jgi:hypothetical protein